MNLSLENDPAYKKVKKETLLFRVGDPVEEILLIKKGQVLVFEINESKIIPLGVYEEKDSLGEGAFFQNEAHNYFAITTQDTEFVVIPGTKMKSYLADQADWINKIFEKISKKLSSTQEVLVEHKVIDDNLMKTFQFSEEFELRLKKILKGE